MTDAPGSIIEGMAEAIERAPMFCVQIDPAAAIGKKTQVIMYGNGIRQTIVVAYATFNEAVKIAKSHRRLARARAAYAVVQEQYGWKPIDDQAKGGEKWLACWVPETYGVVHFQNGDWFEGNDAVGEPTLYAAIIAPPASQGE